MYHTHSRGTFFIRWLICTAVTVFLILTYQGVQAAKEKRHALTSHLRKVNAGTELSRKESAFAFSRFRTPLYSAEPTGAASVEVIDREAATKTHQLAPLIAGLRQHEIDARQTAHGILITLPAELFTFASVSLTNTARGQLRQVAAALGSRATGRIARITGYAPRLEPSLCTDALDLQGIESVALALEASGVGRDRLQLPHDRYLTSSAVPQESRAVGLPPALAEFRVDILIAEQ